MKLAHLILAHKDPQLLGRLVKRLHHENSDVYIQLDKKANIDDFIHLEAIGNTYFIENRVITEWGNYSIIKATLNGFEQILRAGIKYSHINLISGQDYPLKPIEQIQQFLFANTDKTFMHSLSIGDNEWDNGKMRVAKYSFGDYDFPGKYQLQAIVNAVMPNRKLPQKLKPYGRSQWLTITPLCAQYAINYLKNNPKVERFFRMTWAIDELFFQTIIMNSHLKNTVINNNLRLIEMDETNRPLIYTATDIGKLTSTDNFFARKFDGDVDTSILDFIDSVIDKPLKQTKKAS